MSNLAGIIASTLRPWPVTAPAITLSATFPSNLHVGDTVNFDVTATEVDGATGTLTITVDQLPAGVTLGATSQVDATHYKATCSGTLTTAQDVTASFTTTGGSVAATALVHEFNVQAQSAGPQFLDVQTFSTLSNGNRANGDGTFGNPAEISIVVAAGDTITFAASANGSQSGSRSITDSQGNEYSLLAASGSGRCYSVWQTTASVDGTLVIDANMACYNAHIAAVAVRSRGGTTGAPITASAQSNADVGPINEPSGSILIIAGYATSGSPTLSAGGVGLAWTADASQTTVIVGHAVLAADAVDASVRIHANSTATVAGVVVPID